MSLASYFKSSLDWIISSILGYILAFVGLLVAFGGIADFIVGDSFLALGIGVVGFLTMALGIAMILRGDDKIKNVGSR